MLSAQLHRYIFLFGLCALAFGMMMGTVPTSVPQFILLGNFFLELDFARKWRQVKLNPVFWLLSAAFLAHVAGLLHTSDLKAGWDDVRTRLPLVFLPLILLSNAPLSAREIRFVLYSFIGGAFVNTAWCLLYSFVLHHPNEVRNASRFMSHIRLGLYINLAMAALVYSGMNAQRRRWLHALGLLYFLMVLYLLGLASGLMNLLVLLVVFLIWFLLRRGGQPGMAALALAAIFFTGVFFYVRAVARSQLDVKQEAVNTPSQLSAGGHPYIHFDRRGQKENGYYVHMNIQLEELKRAWQRDFPADSFNYGKGHNLERYAVLVRYMAGKGLKKDSVSYLALSAGDKMNIRNGIPNHRYADWNFMHRRIYELVNEYDEFERGGNINGNSITMRLYFWKAALHAIRQHPLVGVGSGDVQAAMNQAYLETRSPLEPGWHKRPHNQFITETLALGLMGLAIFITSIFAPVFILRKQLHLLFWPFFCLLLFSFLFEDTLETQAGLTFYAFFNSLFVSQACYLKSSKNSEGATQTELK